MKIVLVNKKEIKLYNGEFSYNPIVKFATQEFHLENNTISLSFKDEEGDVITVTSDDDLEIMKAVFQGKQYLRINVQASAPKPVEQVKQSVPTEMSETVEAPQVENKSEPICEDRKSKEKGMRGWGCWGRKHRHGSHGKEGSPRSWSGHKKQKMMKLKGFFNDVVTKLVDDRITHMIPCIKERLQKGDESVEKIISDLVHKGYECKGCEMNPISGIRYECPSCSNFNLCEKCQNTVEHEHPLLKIKKIMEEGKDKEDFKFFKRIFKQYFKSPHGRNSSSSNEKCHRKGKGHLYYKKIWGLAIIFGGQPQQYSQYAEKHQDKRPKDVFKQYALDNGMSEEEFNEKFVNFRIQKLAKCFGNPAEKYKAFVTENIDLPQKELMEKLYEQGIEKREDKKCWWGGRRFNFNNSKEEEKQEKSPKEASPKKEKSKKKEKKLSKEKKRKESPSIEQPKPLDSTEVVKQKGAILMKMNEIFGKQNQKTYMKFIDKYFSLGQERIIDLWIQQ